MKHEINHKKKFRKPPNTYRLKNILLKNVWVNQEIKEKNLKHMEANENQNTTTQTLGDATKPVLRRKCIAVQAYLKKQESSQMHKLISHLKELERQQQRKSKARRREIIKI